MVVAFAVCALLAFAITQLTLGTKREPRQMEIAPAE